MSLSIEKFLDDLTAWASQQEDIQAVVLVGSYANDTYTANSDVDVVILCEHPQHYLDHTAWIERFGKVERWCTEAYGRVTSVRVWYQQDREVEFGITDPQWGSDPADQGTQQVIRAGARLLMARGSRFNKLVSDINQVD